MDGIIAGAALKDAQQARWKTSDLLVLIAAKRFEAERATFGKLRDKLRLAEHRWKEVEEFCGREGVHRKAGQCKKRWEKLMTDFKKVYDYQKQISSGQLGYFEQNSDERKKRKLPLSFLHEWYEAMVVWVPNHRTTNLDPDHIMDNIGEGNIPNLGARQESQLTANLDEEEITRVSDGSPIGGDQAVARADDDGSSHGEQGLRSDPNCTTVDTTPSVSERRGWKRGRREKSEDQFTKLTNQFLKAVTAASSRRNAHEEALLALERQRHADQLALERKKHSEQLALERQKNAEQLAQAEKISADISGALQEFSASLRMFTSEIMKKL
ncbi:unnamed protein product [Calypogeia fissa]